jgi:hypothetical protein
MKIEQIDVSLASAQASSNFFNALSKVYDLSNMEVLDAFARNGQLTVSHYAHWVKAVDCWEFCDEHREALQSIAGVREVVIGCSYDLSDAERIMEVSKYDMVVIDAPQSFHNSNHGGPMCGHLDFLTDYTEHLLKDRALVMLYVNKVPYDPAKEGHHGLDSYENFDFDMWMKRRLEFYGWVDINEQVALQAYEDVFHRMGRKIKSVFMHPLPDNVPGKPPAFYMVLETVKV